MMGNKTSKKREREREGKEKREKKRVGARYLWYRQTA